MKDGAFEKSSFDHYALIVPLVLCLGFFRMLYVNHNVGYPTFTLT